MNSLAVRLLNDIPLMQEAVILSWLLDDPTRTAAASAWGSDLSRQVSAAEPAFFTKIRQDLVPKPTLEDGVAILPINGAIAHAPSLVEMIFYGVEDSRALVKMVNAAATNPDARAVVLDINSPGGMVTGGVDIAEAVTGLAKVKPVVTWTGGIMASLGYMIGSQATAVIASSMSTVGSIGAIQSIMDFSRLLENAGIKTEVFTNTGADLKGIGALGTSLTRAQRDHLQARIDAVGTVFKGMVTAKRPHIPESAMKGQVFWGAEAMAQGLVDSVGTQGSAVLLARSLSR